MATLTLPLPPAPVAELIVVLPEFEMAPIPETKAISPPAAPDPAVICILPPVVPAPPVTAIFPPLVISAFPA